jgi:hypothetical protein
MLDILEGGKIAKDLRVLKPLLSQLHPLLLVTVGHCQLPTIATITPDHGVKKVGVIEAGVDVDH